MPKAKTRAPNRIVGQQVGHKKAGMVNAPKTILMMAIVLTFISPS
jgi:hypothetical protein